MIFEIKTREKYAKSEESSFVAMMAHSGLKVKKARLARLYRVDAAFSRAEFARLGSELLTDRITETFSLKPGAGEKGAWRVEVWLRDSVTDVVGESVREAIGDVLGRKPDSVRFGHAWYVSGVSGGGLSLAVKKTLVNETVNKFRIEKI